MIIHPTQITEEMLRLAKTDDLWHFASNLNAMLTYGYCSVCGLCPRGCECETREINEQ